MKDKGRFMKRSIYRKNSRMEKEAWRYYYSTAKKTLSLFGSRKRKIYNG
jgi:hypothetical protein